MTNVIAVKGPFEGTQAKRGNLASKGDSADPGLSPISIVRAFCYEIRTIVKNAQLCAEMEVCTIFGREEPDGRIWQGPEPVRNL